DIGNWLRAPEPPTPTGVDTSLGSAHAHLGAAGGRRDGEAGHMRGPFTRRRLLISGGAAAAAVPLLASRPVAAAATGALTTLRTPVRVFDSREPGNFFGRKLAAGDVVAVAVSGAYQGDDIATAVFVNVTVTQTEGAGYLAV